MKRFISFMVFVLLCGFVFQSYKTTHENLLKTNQEIQRLKIELNEAKNTISRQNKELNSPLYKSVSKCNQQNSDWFLNCIQFEKKLGKF